MYNDLTILMNHSHKKHTYVHVILLMISLNVLHTEGKQMSSMCAFTYESVLVIRLCDLYYFTAWSTSFPDTPSLYALS